jgi:hypothetical protein
MDTEDRRHRISVTWSHLPARDYGFMESAPVPYMVRINGNCGAMSAGFD